MHKEGEQWPRGIPGIALATATDIRSCRGITVMLEGYTHCAWYGGNTASGHHTESVIRLAHGNEPAVMIEMSFTFPWLQVYHAPDR